MKGDYKLELLSGTTIPADAWLTIMHKGMKGAPQEDLRRLDLQG